MPYRYERNKSKIAPEDDRRRKLTEAEVAAIAKNEGGLSQRALAALYGVSRRTITFILDPKKREQNLKRRAERGGSAAYYDKETQRETMKKHRRHKKRLQDEGKLR